MKKINYEEVKEFISKTSSNTLIYIGADSERYRNHGVWYADYTVAIVVHINGNRGCKVFGEVTTERDFDIKKDRPFNRMMNEVYKAVEVYRMIRDVIGDRKIELHLDLNPDQIHGSSCAVQNAIGYVRGMCDITPMVKPNAPAASFCADRLKEILLGQRDAA